VWQQYLERHAGEDFAFLSVAVDVEPERVRPFVAPYDFPTLVDRAGQLGRAYDFDVVPNGLIVDEAGVLRFRHIGGFDIRRPEIAAQLDALLAADFSKEPAPPLVRQESLDLEVLLAELASSPDEAALHYALGDAYLQQGRAREAETALRRATTLDPGDWSAPFALGVALHHQGRTDEALASWRRALALDPANYTVRKQIWMVEHPDKFYPAIDFDWQKEQLAREGVAAS
jgi:tetratricopeptide (TPR) repeat protein